MNTRYQDRRPLAITDLHEPPPPTDLTQKPIRDTEEAEPQGIRAGSSAKIDQLVHLLKLTPSTEKSLVFSQFTSFLDKVTFDFGIFIARLMTYRLRKHWMRRGRSYLLLSNFLDSILFNSIPFVRFDGQMSAKRRRDAINKFSVPLEQQQSIPQTRNACDDDSYGDSMITDDDDEFIDEDDQRAFDKKSKRKGKGKAKDSKSCSIDGGENPRVMLLSLKAVCCLRVTKIP